MGRRETLGTRLIVKPFFDSKTMMTQTTIASLQAAGEGDAGAQEPAGESMEAEES